MSLPTIAFILIILAALLQAAFLLRRENRRDPVSHWLLGAAAVLLAASLVERSVAIRFVAVTNTYESLVFFAAAVCAVLFALRLIRSTRGLSPFVLFGSTVAALVLLAISSSPHLPKEATPPVPALHSYWLVLHVTFAFIGEAFFVVSFVAALVLLVSRNEDRRADMDRLVATAIGIGYPVFSAGALIFGAVWAETAWGAWWSWDPKETWALITWLIYTAYLHTRLVKGMRGRTSAILAVVGFAATVFTFFGVNYLLTGLHSYG
jgi:ABC-type transport system involved in cytochrome c biogenesis permease subunit